MQIDPSAAQEYKLSEHQCSFFNAFLGLYDIQGKDVLEVGGAMPRALVLEHLGARSWTCVQSAEYALHRSDNQEPSGNTHHYKSVYANIEDLNGDPKLDGQFDAVFSIACFEHIHKLPQALNVMYKALKPGGVLFSLFAPIWSGPWGQHFTGTVPDRFDSIKPAEGWATKDIFEPWDHLLMSRFQFFEHYKKKYDAEFAEELTYITYNSPQINRYHFEDYLNFVKQTEFKNKIFNGIFEIHNNTYVESNLKNLRLIYENDAYSNFTDAGIVMLLEK